MLFYSILFYAQTDENRAALWTSFGDFGLCFNDCHCTHQRCFIDEHEVFRAANESSQGSSRHVLSFQILLVLLNFWKAEFTKVNSWWVFKARNSSSTVLIWFRNDTPLFVHIHVTSKVEPPLIFMTRIKVSENFLFAELYFYGFVAFWLYSDICLGFHQKQFYSYKQYSTFVLSR